MTVDNPELDENPELDRPDVPQLPPDLIINLTTLFPPSDKQSQRSSFAGDLVNLMARADEFNLARLFEAFPVFGVAYMLWDQGLIEYAPDLSTVFWKEEHVDKASIMEIQSWSDRCRTLQNVLSYPRTLNRATGQPFTPIDLSHVTPFGALRDV